MIHIVRQWWGPNSTQVLEFQVQRLFSLFFLSFFFHSLSLFNFLPECNLKNSSVLYVSFLVVKSRAMLLKKKKKRKENASNIRNANFSSSPTEN